MEDLIMADTVVAKKRNNTITYDTAWLSTYGTNSTGLNVSLDSFYIDNKPISDVIEELVSKTTELEVPLETKTRIETKDKSIYVKYFKDGHFTHDKRIMPDIKDVKYYNNTVIVIFGDNTQTKAVLDPEDYYSLEQGISICITKKLLGEDGSNIYNKLIRRAFNVINQNAEAAVAAEKKRIKEIAKKEAAAEKRQKKKLKKREEAIEIQKEAYIRAMRELNGNN
jgi:hypothetical protein